MLIAPAAERPGFAGYQFGVADEETTSNERTPLENLPEADANGVATFPVTLDKQPASTRPQEARNVVVDSHVSSSCSGAASPTKLRVIAWSGLATLTVSWN